VYARFLGAVGLVVGLVFIALGIVSVDDAGQGTEVIATAGPAAPVLSPDGQFDLDRPAITVQAHGSVTAPAERVDVALILSGGSGSSAFGFELLDREEIGPILTSLRLAGVPDPTIDSFVSSPFRTNVAGVLRFSWNRPDTFDALLDSVIEAASDTRYSVDGIETVVALDGCEEELATARETAFAAAEAEALELARVAGVTLGEVVAVTETTAVPLMAASIVTIDECGTVRPSSVITTSNLDRPSFESLTVNVSLIVAFAIE
jgi:hypothetical protein